MAVRGNTIPKPPARRRNRAKKPSADVQATPIPAPRLLGVHLPETFRWYERWSHSDQAKSFAVTDWQRLEQMAFLVDRLYDPESSFTARLEAMREIRLNESLLGATLVDRLRLNAGVPSKPADKLATPPANVADLETRRLRLSGA